MRAGVFFINKINELLEHVDEGLLQTLDDSEELIKDTTVLLPHNCNDRCQERTSETDTRCRKLDNAKVKTDNTKKIFTFTK